MKFIICTAFLSCSIFSSEQKIAQEDTRNLSVMVYAAKAHQKLSVIVPKNGTVETIKDAIRAFLGRSANAKLSFKHTPTGKKFRKDSLDDKTPISAIGSPHSLECFIK